MIRPSLFVFALVVGAMPATGAVTPVSAATPEAAACLVEPRPEADLLALGATPTAGRTETAGTPVAFPDGEPADPATILAIEATLREARACAEAGDLPRLLALYSDDFVRNQILRAEPVPIVPGWYGGGETVPVATPDAASPVATVREARLLPDGRVAATVETGDRVDRVLFTRDERRDRWVIDEIHPAAGAASTEQPAPVRAAVEAAAAHLGVPAAELTVVQAESREWSDASLGCPREGEFYAQVITPGYLVLIQGGGRELEYHTDLAGTVVLCAER